MTEQKTDIDILLRDENEFLMIILDAMRYDIFEALTDYDTRKVISPGENTDTWARETFDGEYDDICYITSNPHIGNEGISEYNAGEHFKHIVNVWDFGWDGDVDTVRPPTVVDETIKRADKNKIIAHFMQPHFPHIGEKPLHQRDNRINISVAGPEIGPERVRRSYIENARLVLEKGVKPLIEYFTIFHNRPIVITSDHGELLGEGGEYGHNKRRKNVLEVPWVRIEP